MKPPSDLTADAKALWLAAVVDDSTGVPEPAPALTKRMMGTTGLEPVTPAL